MDVPVESMTEQPQVIEPENVVGMTVREECCVHKCHVFPEQLSAQIRRSVDDEVALRRFDENTRARPLIPWVVRFADWATTPQHGNAVAGSRSHKNKFRLDCFRKRCGIFHKPASRFRARSRRFARLDERHSQLVQRRFEHRFFRAVQIANGFLFQHAQQIDEVLR